LRDDPDEEWVEMAGTALIVGAGSGISASFARALHADGYRVMLSARTIDDLEGLCKETGALAVSSDAADVRSVEALFDRVDRDLGHLDAVLYNASFRTRGPIADLEPEAVHKSLMVSAFGGFLVAQQAARRMLRSGSGAILFTGASASVKGYARSAPFAMGKFALRGLAQSMARELAPKGIHVAHFVIDGGVRSPSRDRVEGGAVEPDSLLDPDAIAATYMHVLKQPRSAWTWEVELRPWTEQF
jgi:NAD(P)-dependent dehydrogenase (short-subunit alcohol dehydrogenase family)